MRRDIVWIIERDERWVWLNEQVHLACAESIAEEVIVGRFFRPCGPSSNADDEDVDDLGADNGPKCEKGRQSIAGPRR